MQNRLTNIYKMLAAQLFTVIIPQIKSWVLLYNDLAVTASDYIRQI